MKQRAIVVTGGAGYVGSHTAFLLAQKGYTVIVLDALVHGQSFTHPWATLVRADYADRAVLDALFRQYTVEAVIHCAAFIEVRKSVSDPLSFYDNNVVKTMRLLEAMRAHQVRHIIFSSSCAVYGMPERVPLTEEHPKKPISPYGATKLMVEMMLADFSRAYDMQYVALRYFNAAGALPEHGLGEAHEPETHLIPVLLKAAMTGQPFTLFGADHATVDGSCVRDYVHVWDIAHAHWRALHYLSAGNASTAFNIGTGHGVSVVQLVAAVQKLLKTTITIQQESVRAGDPPILVADAARAYRDLQWHPTCSDVHTILSTAHAWMCALSVKCASMHTSFLY